MISPRARLRRSCSLSLLLSRHPAVCSTRYLMVRKQGLAKGGAAERTRLTVCVSVHQVDLNMFIGTARHELDKVALRMPPLG